MIALDIDRESLVNKSMEIQIRNKFQLIDRIRSAIFTIDVDIELTKEQTKSLISSAWLVN